MATSYVLPANIAYYVLTKQGVPAANGYMLTLNNDTGAPQATYSDPAGTIANPTLIKFGLDGAPPYPIYLRTGDGFPSYRLETYSASGELIRVATNQPSQGGGGGGNITVNNNVVNYFLNPQFSYWSDGVSFANDALAIGSTQIADEWFYTRATTNATVTISRATFLPGENLVPYSPPYYLAYNCTAAGTDSNNYVSQRFDTVQMLNNQAVTASIYASVLTLGGISELTLVCIQNFGTGGSAPVITPIQTFAINDGWQSCLAAFTIPSIGGKVIGANGDDYLELAWQFKSNQIISVGLVDACFVSGTFSASMFAYLSPEQQYAEILPYNLAGEASDQGTNLVGKKEWGTLENWCQAVQSTNFLIGWNFYNNPNQLGETIASCDNGQYIADQTILLSDGDGIVAKSSFISQPLTLEVLQSGKKFGVFQIIEDVNSANLRAQIASVAASLYADATVTIKIAIIGWGGLAGAEPRQVWASASLPGTDPILAPGYTYLDVSEPVTIGSGSSYPQLAYLNNVAMAGYTSYGVIIWNDGVELGVSGKIYFQNNSLTLGNSAFFPTPLPFQDVLLQCQRYYHRTYSWRETLAVGAITGFKSQCFYPQTNWEVGTTIKTIFPTDLVIPGLITTTSSNLSANYYFPVEMVKAPSLRFFDPDTGVEGQGKLFVSTLGNLIYSSGSFDVAIQPFSGNTRSVPLYFQGTSVTYGSDGTGVIENAPIIIVNIVADALLGV